MPQRVGQKVDEEGLETAIACATSDRDSFRYGAADLFYYLLVAAQVFIPLTVGGGIRSLEDIREVLLAGADKVSLNSAAVSDPQLIGQTTGVFGSQCVVLAINAKPAAPDGKSTPKKAAALSE